MKNVLISVALLISLIFSFSSCKEDTYEEEVYVRDLTNIQLDYHSIYGDVSKTAAPVQLGMTEDILFQRMGKQKEDFKELKVNEYSFTGIALVEHLSEDGTSFFAWHEYQDEAVVVVEGELNSGEVFEPKAYIIHCSNGLVYDEHFDHWRPMTFDDVFWNWVNNGVWPPE